MVNHSAYPICKISKCKSLNNTFHPMKTNGQPNIIGIIQIAHHYYKLKYFLNENLNIKFPLRAILKTISKYCNALITLTAQLICRKIKSVP